MSSYVGWFLFVEFCLLWWWQPGQELVLSTHSSVQALLVFIKNKQVNSLIHRGVEDAQESS